MSDIVDRINDEFDDYQEELLLRDKKLKLLVDFSSYDEFDKCYLPQKQGYFEF